jgi:arylsulfatase A-like enzyme
MLNTGPSTQGFPPTSALRHRHWLRFITTLPRPLLVAFSFLAFFQGLGAAQRKPPNVVLILADDQGWGDLSCHGNTNLKTPHIDSLGKQGASFSRFFVQPVCSPTRAELLTGRYHPRGGVRDVSRGGERLNLDEKTIADVFRAAGYATGLFGKWHHGSQYPYHPNGRGFEEYYGFTSGHWGDYFAPPLDHNGRTVTGKGYLADDLTDHAMNFIASQRERPFFCFLAFNTPHSPMQVPDAYWDRFKSAELKLRAVAGQKEDIPHTRAALAMCENLDHNVGRLLAALERNGLAEQTIIIYLTDNGPNGWRWNGGMKGRKGSTDEGGVRSPLLMRWAGHIEPNTVIEPIAGAIDLLPTLTELTGVQRLGAKPLDGISLAPLLLGKEKQAPDRILFQSWGGKVSARTQRYRLDADGQLYDMVADPGQQHAVTAEHPDTVRQLRAAVAQWRKEVLANIKGKDDRPLTTGYPEFPVTSLPARDGVAHGTVMRSAKAPNCSYFTNWTRPEDCLTWDVEVATAGQYRVEVLFACAKENLGATITFRLGAAQLAHKVTEPHEPPARGDENDRVPRVGESLVKDFRPLALGTVELARGRGELSLQATEIPGKQAIEVRGLRLTLLEPAKSTQDLPPVRAITRGPKFHWFGYYDHLQFDPSGRYVLGMEVDFEHRTPGPDDVVKVGMVDLHDNDRWIELGESRAWNWQQGCMLQWLPGSKSEVIWNDRAGDRFVSHILDVRTRHKRTLPAPIYAISPDGRWAVFPDFRRLHHTRPGYGYAGIADPQRGEQAPEGVGIWRLDLHTGEIKLLLSFADGSRLPTGGDDSGAAMHWYNHLLFAPDGKRFAFLHRWRGPQQGQSFATRLITADLDGKNLYVLDPHGKTSHFIWRDPEHILAWSWHPSGGDGFYLYTDRSRTVEPIGRGVMTENGHCTYLAGNRWILNDTYPDRQRDQHPYLFDTTRGTRQALGHFRSPPEYAGEWRCDTHPRSSPDGRSVVIDSPHGGQGRQLYLIDVGGIVDRA